MLNKREKIRHRSVHGAPLRRRAPLSTVSFNKEMTCVRRRTVNNTPYTYLGVVGHAWSAAHKFRHPAGTRTHTQLRKRRAV